MGILQTAERSSHLDPSENVIFQRHLIAYKEAAKLISGTVLEIGSGEGYGIIELAPKAEHYIAIDKYETLISDELKASNNITFIQSEVPPLKEIEDNSVDFVVSFQVIEHIQDDEQFLQEIHRVLKPGGKLSILEFSKSESKFFNNIFQFYFNRILPKIASFISRADAYRYLPESVKYFPHQSKINEFLKNNNFSEIIVTPLTLGVTTIYNGIKK